MAMAPMAIALDPSHHFLSATSNIGVYPSYIRLLHLANECTDMSQLKQLHAQALRTSSIQTPQAHLFLYSRILHFSSLFALDYAFLLFHQVENPNSFMWNTIIRACSRSIDRKGDAFLLYREMMEQGAVLPDKHTFPFVLKGCAYLFHLLQGKQVHAHLVKMGFESDVHINNSLIHFYATCDCLDLALNVFEKMPERSKVSWNTLMDAYVRAGHFESALKLFGEMQRLYEPDNYTLQSVISACAGLGSLSLGLWVHAYIVRKFDSAGLVNDVLVNTGLVDMYCKCGSLEIAEQIFENMSIRDVNTWNSMILGFAMHGKAETALRYFSHMVRTKRTEPNSITFLGVLSACNHRGMVDEGSYYFHMMINEFNIKPQIEHYGCLVNLLTRAGFIEETLDLVSKMPMKPDAVIWRSLLDACCKQNASVGLSEEVARQILESEESACSGVYVLLSKVYASANRWNDVGLIRKLMTDKGVAKEPGCSLIEIDGGIHEFFAGDTTNPQSECIYKMLGEIEDKLELNGYRPDYSGATLVDEINEGKGRSLRLHSERLAIAFGLLNLRPGQPIRVFKNLRVCNDCHEVTKLISKMFKVEIIVRDRARFHHFKDGICSCMDYW